MAWKHTIMGTALLVAVVGGLDFMQAKIDAGNMEIAENIAEAEISKPETIQIELAAGAVVPAQDTLETIEVAPGHATEQLIAYQREAEQLRDEIAKLAGGISSNIDEIARYEGKLENKEAEREKNRQLAETYMRVYYQANRDASTRLAFIRAKNIKDMIYRYDTVHEMMSRIDRVVKRDLKEETEIENDKSMLQNRTNLYSAQLADAEKRYAELAAKEAEIIEYLQKNGEDLALEQLEAIGRIGKYISASPYSFNEPSHGGKFMALPVSGEVTSSYGNRMHPIFGEVRHHAGVDIGVDYGTPVRAAADGIVIMSGWYGGYGKVIMLDHGNGIVSLYGHNDKVIAKKGDIVTKGQVVALAGATGNATGPHCHFEVRLDGNDIDPYTFVL